MVKAIKWPFERRQKRKKKKKKNLRELNTNSRGP